MFGRKKKNAAERNEKSPSQNEAALAIEPTQNVMADDALIAVITAAVALSLGTSANGIVIKSIKRTGQAAPAWGVRGRIEQIFSRL